MDILVWSSCYLGVVSFDGGGLYVLIGFLEEVLDRGLYWVSLLLIHNVPCVYIIPTFAFVPLHSTMRFSYPQLPIPIPLHPLSKSAQRHMISHKYDFAPVYNCGASNCGLSILTNSRNPASSIEGKTPSFGRQLRHTWSVCSDVLVHWYFSVSSDRTR